MLFVLLSSLAYAQEITGHFTTELTPVKNFISQGEKAVFKLTVINEYNIDDEFDLRFTNDPRWAISTSPTIYYSSEYGMAVPSGEERDAIIELLPSKTVKSGVYALEVYVTSKATGITKIENILISVKPDKEPLKEYLPAFTVDISVPDKVDPRESFPVKVTITNKNPVPIDRMVVVLKSNLVSRKILTKLKPLETKTEEITVKLDPLQIPTKDRLRAKAVVEKDNRSFEANSQPAEYEITGYSFIEKTSSVDDEFLKTVEKITVTNDGNVDNTAEIRVPVTTFEKLFTKVDPAVDVTEEAGRKAYVWKITLAPQESKSVTLVVNYRPLFIVFLILLISAVSYILLRSPLVITKSAIRLGKKDSELSYVKVVLLIKNRGKKPIDNVKITDTIPNIAEVEKDFQVGTLAPTKIVKKKSGTKVIWEIPSIEPFEERIITYKIKSSLSIVGGIYLPPSEVKYSASRGGTASVLSNKVEIE